MLTYIPLSINRNNNTIKRICRLGNSCHLTNKVVLTLSVFSSGSQAQKSPWPLDGHTNIVLEEHEGSRERNSSYSIVYNSISCLIQNEKTSKLKKNIYNHRGISPIFFIHAETMAKIVISTDLWNPMINLKIKYQYVIQHLVCFIIWTVPPPFFHQKTMKNVIIMS